MCLHGSRASAMSGVATSPVVGYRSKNWQQMTHVLVEASMDVVKSYYANSEDCGNPTAVLNPTLGSQATLDL